MADLPETKFDLWRRYVGAILAPLGFAVLVLLPIPDAFVEAAKGLLKETTATPQVLDVASSARTVLATTWLMVALWLSEAVPLAATAFLRVPGDLPLHRELSLGRGPVPVGAALRGRRVHAPHGHGTQPARL
jgi:hypothetical protein